MARVKIPYGRRRRPARRSDPARTDRWPTLSWPKRAPAPMELLVTWRHLAHPRHACHTRTLHLAHRHARCTGQRHRDGHVRPTAAWMAHATDPVRRTDHG